MGHGKREGGGGGADRGVTGEEGEINAPGQSAAFTKLICISWSISASSESAVS